MSRRVVVVGGGQAGLTVVDSLLARGFEGHVTIVEAGNELPYQRPPLSKAYLAGTATRWGLRLRPAAYFASASIELLLGERLIDLDRSARTIGLASGRSLVYDDLVIATGSTPRPWTGDGAELDGLHRLHDIDDADLLRAALVRGGSLVVVGGGFIGLEVASLATKMGMKVTVLEAGPRLMARSVSPRMSGFFAMLHEKNGVAVRCSVAVSGFVGTRRVEGVRLQDGEILPTDLVVLGIGSRPALDGEPLCLATAPDGSLIVDGSLRTSDPHVFACGDTVSFRHDGRRVRLESVQNATDQARQVAATIMGASSDYQAVPWFWTEQHGVKLQTAGLTDQADEWVLRGDPDCGRWSVFAFRDGVLVGSESVGAVSDHIATRSLLRTAAPVSTAEVADPDFDLKARASRATELVKESQ